MSARRWRGTAWYVGAVAVLGVAGVARFAGPDQSAQGTAQGADAAASGGSSERPGTGAGSSATGSGSIPASGDPSGTDSSASSATDAVTVSGATVGTRYGDVQVALTVDGDGTITGVQTLQQPDEEQESVDINGLAVPELEQQVLDAQSGDLDTVSGATYTSEGYRISVQSALDQLG